MQKSLFLHNFFWYLQMESNHHRRIRNPIFYPLNYGGEFFKNTNGQDFQLVSGRVPYFKHVTCFTRPIGQPRLSKSLSLPCTVRHHAVPRFSCLAYVYRLCSLCRVRQNRTATNVTRPHRCSAQSRLKGNIAIGPSALF